MNIIDFLIEDHSRLLRDRVEIRKSLSEKILLKKRILRYIADLELHETIENKFLVSKLSSLTGEKKLYELIANCEKEHVEIWSYIRRLLDAVKTEELQKIQQSFFDFFGFVEAHTGVEERTFFPTVRELLDDKTLEELGQKAEKYYERYHHAMEKA